MKKTVDWHAPKRPCREDGVSMYVTVSHEVSDIRNHIKKKYRCDNRGAIELTMREYAKRHKIKTEE